MTGDQIVIMLSIICVVFFGLLVREFVLHKKIKEKYKDIIDIDKRVDEKNKELKIIIINQDKAIAEHNNKIAQLKADYSQKHEVYKKLLHELSIVEEDLEFTSYALYKPHYEFDTSDKFKTELEKIREQQKSLIQNKKAIVCHTEWRVGNSKTEGKKMTNQYMRLMLRAFNNECDAALLKVNWKNITKMEARIDKAFEAINKLGTVYNITIEPGYLKSKLNELYLAYEYQGKIQEEKEEQKQIREQMREEAIVLKEIEKAEAEAIEEEKRYEKALAQARELLKQAQGAELSKLENEIAQLQKQLEEAIDKKQRAKSRAQMTKSGHVYVISNIGSFGKDVLKIGMTRRLDPLDRVKELGDASVPFSFDIHAMIYSEDAPLLESELHASFNDRRVNMVNTRKEYFRTNLDEIEKIVRDKQHDIELIKVPEAKEYHETLAILNQMNSLEDTIKDAFPEEI